MHAGTWSVIHGRKEEDGFCADGLKRDEDTHGADTRRLVWRSRSRAGHCGIGLYMDGEAISAETEKVEN